MYAYSKENGGFFLRKSPGGTDYSITNILPADQASADSTAREKFEKTCSLNAFAPRLHSFLRASPIFLTTEVLFASNVKIVSQETAGGPFSKIVFRQVAIDSIPNSSGMSGTVVVDKSNDSLISTLDYKSPDMGAAGFYHDARTYYSPTNDIPHSMLKEINITERVSGGKVSNERKFFFSDYKIESAPPNKLRLSYYGIDNSLTASKSSPRWPYFVVAGVLALVGVGVWLARRKRMTGA